jgi:hypothetical protein
MTSPLYDMLVAPVVADLLACLTIEMGKTPQPPASVCVRVGNRVDLLLSDTYDECCAGLAWVRLVRQYPSRSFPDPDEGVSPCDVARWAIVFELGVARCAPTGDLGTIPSCEDWTAAAVIHYADLAALRRTACCYATQYRGQRKIVVSEGVPQTTEGGCTSLTMQVTISALACDPVCKEIV